MKIYIIYSRIFDLNGEHLTIGGIQTYLLNLAELLIKNNYEVIIYQSGNKDWNKKYNNIEFKGINVSNEKVLENQRKKVFESVLNTYKTNDLVIWGTDGIAIKNDKIKSISIQHGITFDFLSVIGKKYILLEKLGLKKLIMYFERKKAIETFMNAKVKVCVDYNFLNWIRTMEFREDLKDIYVIPNFTHINNSQINKDSNKIKILFARRFMMERGVYILEDIINNLADKYDNVSFTIAGSGQLEKYVKEKIVKNRKNVCIISYEHHESLKIHSEHDISLVPSFGSEGTSLSLLEAMTSKCIPIASNVGGMTNIILDEFNGYLVNPDSSEFIEKLEILINNTELRNRLQENAKKSADESFSYQNWSNKWLDLIKKV